MSKKIVFFGTEDFSLKTLRLLLEADYTIEAVVTKPDSKRGRGQRVTQSAVKKFASAHNITVLEPAKLSDIHDVLSKMMPVAGVLASYGKIIPESLIDLFYPGIINIHPSLLPKYRGPSPIESVILNGDKETGVSIMQLSAEMDAGPVYASVTYNLDGNETRPELYENLAETGARLLLQVLPEIIEGKLLATKQDESQATYCSMLQKKDSWLRPDINTAQELERQVRAYLGFPKTRFNILGHEIIITKAHVSEAATSSIDIPCKDRSYLVIDELVGPNGKTMGAKDFINGYAG